MVYTVNNGIMLGLTTTTTSTETTTTKTTKPITTFIVDLADKSDCGKLY